MKRTLLILTLLLSAATADALTWRTGHFKGLYVCNGSAPGYTWMAVLGSNGKGSYAAVDIVGTRSGVSDAAETSGWYSISEAGLITLRFGTGTIDGFLVQGGKGVLLNNNLMGFTGECWREK